MLIPTQMKPTSHFLKLSPYPLLWSTTSSNSSSHWQKPVNNTCYLSRGAGVIPPLCNSEDDPDNVWYVDLKACITRIEENGYGANLAPWPARLQTPPDRLQTIQIDSYIARKELFVAESKYWKEIISNYVNALHWKQIGLRNVMDMRAGFGGFAAALAELKVDCWVLNVIPVSGPNTLPVIYDRGLLGVMHDWYKDFLVQKYNHIKLIGSLSRPWSLIASRFPRFETFLSP